MSGEEAKSPFQKAGNADMIAAKSAVVATADPSLEEKSSKRKTYVFMILFKNHWDSSGALNDKLKKVYIGTPSTADRTRIIASKMLRIKDESDFSARLDSDHIICFCNGSTKQLQVLIEVNDSQSGSVEIVEEHLTVILQLIHKLKGQVETVSGSVTFQGTTNFDVKVLNFSPSSVKEVFSEQRASAILQTIAVTSTGAMLGINSRSELISFVLEFWVPGIISLIAIVFSLLLLTHQKKVMLKVNI